MFHRNKIDSVLYIYELFVVAVGLAFRFYVQVSKGKGHRTGQIDP